MSAAGPETAPRCLVCDVELELPAGGGRTPRFCSGAHRARYNRDQSHRSAPRPPATSVTAPAVAEFEAAVGTVASAGRRLVEAATASTALSAELAREVARADQAEADRDAAIRAHTGMRGQVDALHAAVGALRAQLAAEKELRGRITADRDRLAAPGR